MHTRLELEFVFFCRFLGYPQVQLPAGCPPPPRPPALRPRPTTTLFPAGRGPTPSWGVFKKTPWPRAVQTVAPGGPAALAGRHPSAVLQRRWAAATEDIEAWLATKPGDDTLASLYVTLARVRWLARPEVCWVVGPLIVSMKRSKKMNGVV